MAEKIEQKTGDTPKGRVPMRFNENDLLLIKSLFKNNEALLYALRKVFFQVELNEKDIMTLKPIMDSKEAIALMKKTYYPEIDLDAPFGQVVDLWLTVSSENKDPEEIYNALLVRQRLMQLIRSGLNRFEGLVDEGIKTPRILDFAPDFEEGYVDNYVEYTARNALISHTEMQLTQLLSLAGREEESVEGLQARFKKNSTK